MARVGSALVGDKFTFTKHVVGGTLGSGEAATIYTTETENTPTGSNVLTTDNKGSLTQGEAAIPAYAPYWIPEGRYDILISGSGLTSVYTTRELVTTMVNAALEKRVLSVVSHSTSVTAEPGEVCLMTASATVGLAFAPLNYIVGAICAEGTTTVKTEGGGAKIFGDFLAEAGVTEVKLTKGQHCIFLADGSNWHIIAGEPKREQLYTALTKVFNMVGPEAYEHEYSPTRPTWVRVKLKSSAGTENAVTVEVGGIVTDELGIAASTAVLFPILVPAGQKLKIENGSAGNVEVLTATLQQ
jgi:hypothetical protein